MFALSKSVIHVSPPVICTAVSNNSMMYILVNYFNCRPLKGSSKFSTQNDKLITIPFNEPILVETSVAKKKDETIYFLNCCSVNRYYTQPQWLILSHGFKTKVDITSGYILFS